MHTGTRDSIPYFSTAVNRSHLLYVCVPCFFEQAVVSSNERAAEGEREGAPVDWIESDYSAETAMRFARSGAWVRIATAEDACEVCQAMASRVYLPSDVPRLPLRGCTRERCRCTFVAVDPETKQTVPGLVQWGARVLKQGRADLARHVLRRAVSLDERYEPGWLWLSAVVDDEEKIACLEKVLALSPHNERAAAGLESLRRETGRATAARAPAPTPLVRTTPVGPSAPRAPVPPQVLEIREERQVILGQWQQFLEFAVNMDARTLFEQGRAFLNKLDGLDRQALSLLAPDERLDELRLQQQELAERMTALQATFQVHPAQGESGPGAQAMAGAVDSLTRHLDDRQEAMREQIAAAGGSVSRE
jgi:hypothetical protein